MLIWWTVIVQTFVYPSSSVCSSSSPRQGPSRNLSAHTQAQRKRKLFPHICCLFLPPGFRQAVANARAHPFCAFFHCWYKGLRWMGICFFLSGILSVQWFVYLNHQSSFLLMKSEKIRPGFKQHQPNSHEVIHIFNRRILFFLLIGWLSILPLFNWVLITIYVNFQNANLYNF